MPDAPVPVLQLIDGFATEEQSGGAAQFGIQLARHLDRSLYQPHVCALWRYNTPSEKRWLATLRDEGIGTTILVDRPARIGPDMLRAAAYLRQVVRQVQPRIVNSHFERGDLLGVWSKLGSRRLRIVRTMHADQQWQTRPWLGTLVNLLAFPWFFDAEVAISEATRHVMDTRVAARLARRRALLLYNGISRKLLYNPTRPTTASAKRVAHVAIIGRLEAQKGHQYFLEAAAKVRQSLANVEFWVVGTGSLLEHLQARVLELGLTDAVEFLGQRSDIPHILSAVDLFVSSSIWEGFPTVLLEAMAARVPVVATDVSGSRELVQHGVTGVLVPAKAIGPLADAMLFLLQDRVAAAEMADRAWNNVQRYTIEATAQGYDQLYKQLLSK